jgi:hypothetical protein
MTKRTKQLFVISTVSLVLSSAVAGVFFLKVEGGRQKLEEQTRVLTENNAKEFSYIKLKKLVTETEEDRAQLDRMFFANEGESIAFLGEAEAIAKNLNLSLKTEALDKVDQKDKGTAVRVVFSFEGSKQSVLRFSKLMELVPYQSTIESLELRQLGGESWRGRLSMLITIQSYDKQ